MAESFRVAIIGAGIGGLGLASRLLRDGERSVVLLEKEQAVGGTWRDNTYPGASCDVESHLYWYSFDEQPDWSRIYAFQPEIQANVEGFVEREGLAQHLRLGAEVQSARWDEGRARWLVTTTAGDEVEAQVLVTAWGQLNRPSFKGVPGRERFAGPSFHSARWDHDVDLTGRVACVGNGASAVQLVPEVAETAAHLTIFQRTPNYHVPREDRPYDDAERERFRQRDELMASRQAYFEEHEGWMGAMKLEDNPVAEEFTRVAREHLDTQVSDPALRERLWPDYPIGCKRLLITDTYLPTLTRDNVELVTDKIDTVEATGVRTADGTLHEADVIIYSTGFETLSFLGALDVRGRDGLALQDAWKQGPQAYLGMNVAGFPNLFMLYGPNTNLGHNSIIAMMECQYDYILQALAAADGRALDVRPEVMATYNDQLQSELAGSSFSGSCNSWYKTPEGRVTNNWSGSVEEYRARTSRFALDDYELLAPAT